MFPSPHLLPLLPGRSYPRTCSALRPASSAQSPCCCLPFPSRELACRFATLEMEAAGLRERTASNGRLKSDLRATQEHATQIDADRNALSTQLQATRARSSELELEVSSLKEAAIEADRLQHELSATREKMRVMEQRAAILDRERQGAAQQLQAELDAARAKVAALDARRTRRRSSVQAAADEASTIASGVSGGTGTYRTARSATPSSQPVGGSAPLLDAYGSPLAEVPSRTTESRGAAYRAHRSTHGASAQRKSTQHYRHGSHHRARDASPRTAASALPPRDRYVDATPRSRYDPRTAGGRTAPKAEPLRQEDGDGYSVYDM